jgi:hypothetical protein
MKCRVASFLPWFENSKVTDEFGHPLVVYRGEHGPIDLQVDENDHLRKWGGFQTRLGALSFGSERAAMTYALKPNRQDDFPLAPRVASAHLSIRNPVMNQPNDPFVELGDIARAVGANLAKKIAVDMKDHITNTNRWSDEIGLVFETFDDYFRSASFSFEDLYFDAYALFDEPTYAAMFKVAGFDGAIHGGSGATFGETEFKVFGAKQVWPLSSRSASYEKLAR